MIGSFITRVLVMIIGYAYPAYECYKTVKGNTSEIEQLRFWCKYWILVALFTVCERISDAFISWIPMYSEAKLAFVIYLLTMGTKCVYESFSQYVDKHEGEIDGMLSKLRTRPVDWQRAASFGMVIGAWVLSKLAMQDVPAQDD